MKNVLILLDNSFESDRRVLMTAKSLVENGYVVNLLAVKHKKLEDREEIEGFKVTRIFEEDIFDPKKIFCFKKYANIIINDFSFDIVHANDQTMLYLGSLLKKSKPQIKLIYDSHELFRAWPINTNAKGLTYVKSIIVRKFLQYREAKNIKKADALITVNESIRNDLLFHFDLKINSVSIRNLPLNQKVNLKNNLREKFGLDVNAKILIYIGSNIYPKSINIEQVISEFANKENVYMIFICSFNWGKIEVEKFAKSIRVNNLFFHEKIPLKDINDYLSQADVGIVSSWNKKDLSYWYGLDNKLFEYMMAEIPILATKQPEYINIVEKYGIGICINPETESYFDAFQKILNDTEKFKNNLIIAKKTLNWEEESKKLINFYTELLN
jgi:glycosyltransferase involved in cell wall biosynthesis